MERKKKRGGEKGLPGHSPTHPRLVSKRKTMKKNHHPPKQGGGKEELGQSLNV